jgi:hypothetical protein
MSPDDIIAMVKKSPSYVQYTDVICPTCQEDKYGEFSSTCEICRGWYHNACQTLQSYFKDGHRPILLCNFCRELRIREIAVALMWDCNICRKWVERKKREVADLVTSRVRQARLNNLLLQKEDTIQEYIFGRINETEETITELKADDPDATESDLEPTTTREHTHQFPQSRENEEDALLIMTPQKLWRRHKK